MNSSVKLIFVALFLTSLFSCSSSNDAIFDEMPATLTQVGAIEQKEYHSFLNIKLTPSADAVCTKDLIVDVELSGSDGSSYSETVVAKDGVIHFSYDNNNKGGNYSIVFRKYNSDQVIKSTSLFITTNELDEEYYLKTLEYSNCNF